jgi:prophage regulatory protein
MSTSLHRMPEVCARVGLRPSRIYEMVASKEFPAPIALGVRARAWSSDDIDAWIAERVATSRAARKAAA